MRPDAAAPPPRAESFYRPELDGLRFFAFLTVFLNHTLLLGAHHHHHRLPDALANALGTVGLAGAFGVDLFFVLSAYLITALLLRERAATGELKVGAFYLRRILRIWPLYFCFLALAWALTWLVPGEQLDWKLLLGFACFSGNWAFLLHPVATVAAPLWSVSVEEQFYLLWPWAVRRGSARRMARLALGLVAVGVVLRAWLALGGLNEPFVSHGSLTRVDGIAAGVLLALALGDRLPRLAPRVRALLLLASLAALLAAAAWLPLFAPGPVPPTPVALGWPLVALAAAGVVLAALDGRSGPGALLASRPLVYLGRISYGLYVFHQLGLLLAERAFPRHQTSLAQFAGYFAAGLLATVALAAASYRWLETPFLGLKQRFTVVRSRPDPVAPAPAAATAARPAPARP